MPLHAAAPIETPYIQSYTSTLESLLRARNKVLEQASQVMTAIGVSKASAHPMMPGLKGIEVEITHITRIFGQDQVLVLSDTQATVANVLEHIKKSSWVHLACHGVQDPLDPLKSCLLLDDGKLELQKLLAEDLPYAKNIFLSACETAMGDSILVNESMHLTGAFITAGFQGAIGTLWRIADSDGPKVAECVYQTVCRDQGLPNHTLTAEGLHIAVKKLRESGASFEQWAPFVHFGI